MVVLLLVRVDLQRRNRRSRLMMLLLLGRVRMHWMRVVGMVRGGRDMMLLLVLRRRMMMKVLLLMLLLLLKQLLLLLLLLLLMVLFGESRICQLFPGGWPGKDRFLTVGADVVHGSFSFDNKTAKVRFQREKNTSSPNRIHGGHCSVLCFALVQPTIAQ